MSNSNQKREYVMKKTVKNSKMIFGDGYVSVQSMTNLPVTDIDATAEQIRRLTAAGCEIVRIAVPNSRSAVAFGEIRKQFPSVPLVADIHFDYRLALQAMDSGADKIRINPGNVSARQLDEVISCAKANDVIVRLGVNGGSVNKQSLAENGGDKRIALISSLKDYVGYFEKQNFTNLVLSVKSSDVRETVALNRLAAQLDYPLHLGVTEAGPEDIGLVKNCVGIGSLLLDGIGDTVRVSLTADPVKEVYAALNLLRALELRKGVTFVSCPQCGRCSIDLERIANKIYSQTKDVDVPLKIAVMGCEVNGPGECSDADLGIAGANGKFVLFRKGQKFSVVEESCGVQAFMKEFNCLVEEYRNKG